MRPPAERSVALAGLVLGLAATLSLVFIGLGRESLLGDEALYAAVARDSAAAGPWFPLVYDGEPYTGKPPLGIWLERVGFALFGFDESVARAPAAVAGAIAITLFGFGTARRHGAFAGVVAAALLGTGHFLLIRHGLRRAVFEGPLLLAMIGAVQSLSAPPRAGRRFGGAPLWCAFGAAFKGLIAPAMLLVFGGAYALLSGRHRPARFGPRLLVAVGAGFAVSTLWLGALAVTSDASPGAVLRREIWDRASTGIDADHLGGLEVYAQVLQRDFGLWFLLIAGGLLALKPRAEDGPTDELRRAWAKGLAWALAPTALLLLSASKLPWYLYPALPGYALLVGLGAETLRRRLAVRHAALALAAAILIAAALAPRYIARFRRVTSDRPELVTLRALADLAALDRRRVVIFDRVDDPLLGPVREWHWLYLNVARRRAIGLDAPLGEGDCPLVVTPRPDVAAIRFRLVGAPVAKVHAVTAGEQPLVVMDGCGGEVAAGLSALKTPAAPADAPRR